MEKYPLFKLLLLFLLVFIFHSATAQKLPDVQQVSLRAPADIKIDGKATEWNNQFQADNNTTHIEYTLSNDDKNLYLTVQALDHAIIYKIMFGGVSLTINTSGKKDVKEAANITYPSFEKGKKNFAYINFGDVKAGTDSLVIANNSQLVAKSKFIRVTGIKGMDTLTSVYNREGIKAVSLFDNKMVYTYELSIDLKLLGLDTTKPEKFAYNIALPGKPSIMDIAKKLGGTNLGPVRITHQGPIQNPDNPHGYLMDVPTDFWGEYTLAK